MKQAWFKESAWNKTSLRSTSWRQYVFTKNTLVYAVKYKNDVKQ